MLTGESMPVDKGEGDPVFTGTINQFGRLEVRAEKVGAETTLGQVIRLLAEAQRHRSPLERTADRYARRFLPAVLIVAAVVFLATNAPALWRWIAAGATPAIDVMPALAVLVVACPCALVLATPAAVLAATARLARRGVLVKGGAAIERLARVDTIAFDKTGTLTEGQARAGRLHRRSGRLETTRRRTPPGRRRRAAQRAPAGAAARRRGPRRGLDLPAVDDFQAQPGAGVSATLRPAEADDARRRILVGNLRLVREQGVDVPAEVETAIERWTESGQTALIVARRRPGRRRDRRPRPRPARRRTTSIHDLKHLGLKDLTILTGDRAAAGAGRGEEGAYQAGRGRADARRQGRVDRAAAGATGGSWRWSATASTTPPPWPGPTSGWRWRASAATWRPRPARSS